MTKVLVCLHGWGGSKESFTELRSALEQSDYTIITPDLPGFGQQLDPPHPWNTDDYSDWVIQWIQTELQAIPGNIQHIALLGHSHGGRIAIALAHRQCTGSTLPFTINHLYLCAAAGIRHPRHIKRIIGLSMAKTGKFFLRIPGLHVLAPLARKALYKLVRVHDYEKANEVMQTTLQLVTAQDLRELLPAITITTDIFWGKQDGMTPFSDALLIEARMPNATLHAFDGVRHGVHRVKAEEIGRVILTD